MLARRPPSLLHLTLEIISEAPAEFGARAEKKALHCWDRQIEDLGDLLVTQIVVSPQNYCHALAFRKPGDGLLDRLLEFGL